MKKSILTLCFSFILVSCVSNVKHEAVERKVVYVDIVKKDLMTSMPGEFLAFEDKLVWFDLNSDSFLHVEDKISGETLVEGGKLGQGPQEFLAPYISWFPDNNILISDCFADKAVVLSLDSLKEYYSLEIPISKQSLQCVGHDQFVRMVLNDSVPFVYCDSGSISYFGNYPIERHVSDANDVFQGVMSYNPYNDYLVYSIPRLSYISLFEKQDTLFREVWSKQISKLEYDILNDNTLKVEELEKYAPSAIALTKNYIVTIERDLETTETVVSGAMSGNVRRFSRTPQTLFVYDYNYNLKKILHTKIPMFRLAATGNDNNVYFIGVKEEFCIGKCVVDDF